MNEMAMDFEDLQKRLDRLIYEQNNRAIEEFEGYSPYEMHHILHATFEPESPISLQKMSVEDYEKIPMLNQIKYFLGLIEEEGEIELTAKGFLRTKMVKDIYEQGYLEEKLFKSGISKLYKESDSMTVSLTRILPELAGLTKKRKRRLSLTKKGERVLSNNDKLLKLIFTTMATKYNWAYFDGYGDNNFGQFGYGFSLILLSKYGNTQHIDRFYANMYIKAFPDIEMEGIYKRYISTERYNANCYSLRFFSRFLDYFGLIRIDEEKAEWNADKFITKTALFDKFIKVRPHKKAPRARIYSD